MEQPDSSPKPAPFGRPFAKGGDPRINRSGPTDAKTRKFRKALARMDAKALAMLTRFLDSDDPDYQLEGLKLFFKYRLPVPTEKNSEPLGQTGPTFNFSPEVRAALARLT
jgi:hypothetical protein